MARWHLGYAAELGADPRLAAVRARLGLDAGEVAAFRAIAEGLYVIPPDKDGIVEEFDGFFGLSTDLNGVSERFCEHTQAVKQPDLLALYLPFGSDYPEKVLQENWRYYTARTRHGSSLSLPGTALAAALAGLPDEAVPYFQRAARMDLDDVNMNAHMGVHLAGYAVLWEALVFGFGGFRPHADRIEFRPCLPRLWGGVAFALHWRGNRLDVHIDHARIRVACPSQNPHAVPVSAAGRAPYPVQPGKEQDFEIA